MAVITSYTTLDAAVDAYLARSDLSDYVPNFIQNFEEKFFRQPKNYGKWMESTLNVAISTTAALPSDYLALRIAYLSGKENAPLIPVTLDQMLSMYPRAGDSGQPKWIARNAETFIFGPVPGANTYTLAGTYYAKPTALRSYAGDAAAHWLIVNAPDLLLYGALLEATPFLMNDRRLSVWQGFLEQARQDYRDLMRAQNMSGGTPQMLVA